MRLGGASSKLAAHPTGPVILIGPQAPLSHSARGRGKQQRRVSAPLSFCWRKALYNCGKCNIQVNDHWCCFVRTGVRGRQGGVEQRAENRVKMGVGRLAPRRGGIRSSASAHQCPLCIPSTDSQTQTHVDLCQKYTWHRYEYTWQVGAGLLQGKEITVPLSQGGLQGPKLNPSDNMLVQLLCCEIYFGFDCP